MSTFDLEDREVVAEFGRAWWIFLVTGILWFLVSIIILRFDYTSVSAISILFGVVAIVGIAADEGAIASDVGASLVGAGMISVLTFPLVGLYLAGRSAGTSADRVEASGEY